MDNVMDIQNISDYLGEYIFMLYCILLQKWAAAVLPAGATTN